MNITTLSGTVKGYKDAGSYHSVSIDVQTYKHSFQVNIHAGAELANLKPGDTIVATGRLTFQKYNIQGVNQERPVLKANSVAKVGQLDMLERERGESKSNKTQSLAASTKKANEDYDNLPW